MITQPTLPLSDAVSAKKRIGILAQYVKDLSFESPGVPGLFRQPRKTVPPEIKLGIRVDVRPVDALEGLFEIVLNLEATASRDSKTEYLVELSYAGLASVKDIEPARADWALRVEIPQLLFPFVRNMVAELTRDGGHQPLLLWPIDFAKAYLEQVGTKGTTS